MHTNPVIDLLCRHRSIRAFTPEPLPDETVEAIIDAGRRASTSSNMQSYTVISVQRGPRRERLAELCGGQKQIPQAATFLVVCADLHRLALVADMHNCGPINAAPSEALVVASVDAALVLQNMAVAAESFGLGICMIGAIRDRPRAVAELLSLPRLTFALAGLCVGHPAKQPHVKPRLPLSAVWHRETYADDRFLVEQVREYDRIMTEWYASHGLHPKDPRWSAVMAERASDFSRRTELSGLLREQGFGPQADPGADHQP
jgi:nitroreductase